ncbi:hypothetical protein EDB84DRAFT_447415 [Lactarius hengduanensis]|nr:hypothetical protein EDB84DRAFT_447415 [Lactarius hengduanensis]
MSPYPRRGHGHSTYAPNHSSDNNCERSLRRSLYTRCAIRTLPSPPRTGSLLHARVVDLDALEGCLYRSLKRIYSKILATSVRYKPKVLVSQIWNAIIFSMYREHLLSIDHVQKLLYHQADTRWPAQSPCSPLLRRSDRQGLQGQLPSLPARFRSRAPDFVLRSLAVAYNSAS